MTADQLRADVAALSDPECARNRARFFKTGAGQYGEGDRFLGLTVPQQRGIAERYSTIKPAEIERLLASEFHEHRFIGLAILVGQYQRAGSDERDALVTFYLRQLSQVNNWDLVDASAPYILGEHWRASGDEALDSLAESADLWKRRVAVVATLGIVKGGRLEPALRLCEKLLGDKHDLIHKAVGWVLREVGRKDRATLLTFLDQHYSQVPRTALRYAIEHLPPEEREAALSGHFTIQGGGEKHLNNSGRHRTSNSSG